MLTCYHAPSAPLFLAHSLPSLGPHSDPIFFPLDHVVQIQLDLLVFTTHSFLTSPTFSVSTPHLT